MDYKLCKTTLAAFALAVCLSGCGKNTDEEKELAVFSESLSDFSNALKETDSQINQLDVTQEDSSDQMLKLLDNLDEEFAKLARISVPDQAQYQGIEPLAAEASQNMSEAVAHYHSAFESETYNAYDAEIAYQYYVRAMERVEYIGHLLSGNDIPENDHVTIFEETAPE